MSVDELLNEKLQLTISKARNEWVVYKTTKQ
jgi:hypothetical protein